MDKKILVTYASKYGSTREIAEKIGATLREAELQVDVCPVTDARDLSPYQAVIVGSAVYVGKWQKEAVKFLQIREKDLARLPVWIFSSGPTGEGDPVELVEGKRLPEELKPLVDRIGPRSISVFHGNIDPAKVNFIERWAVKDLVKKPFGDYRDWNAITAWANNLADTVKKDGVAKAFSASPK
jgi:menaquinone-dependent protoporphyrinogen oxidase